MRKTGKSGRGKPKRSEWKFDHGRLDMCLAASTRTKKGLGFSNEWGANSEFGIAQEMSRKVCLISLVNALFELARLMQSGHFSPFRFQGDCFFDRRHSASNSDLLRPVAVKDSIDDADAEAKSGRILNLTLDSQERGPSKQYRKVALGKSPMQQSLSKRYGLFSSK
jgi:hypothetical protein